jgi:hypothetical protein
VTAASGVTGAQVLAAAREAVASVKPEDDPIVWYGALHVAVARDLGVDLGHGADPYGHARDSLGGQVKRALDKLAEEGALVRYGSRDHKPGRFGWLSGEVAYYTPGQDQLRRAEDAKAADAARATEAAWSDVWDQLDTLGVASMDPRGRPVRLSLGSWQALIKLLHSRVWPDSPSLAEALARVPHAPGVNPPAIRCAEHGMTGPEHDGSPR